MATNNRLIHEQSPYLLQHADNPVDWYPWGEEAFRAAREADKPIFLSIGYATCHWCHVMARESFEDEEVARLMNDTFISIKVDREERPDLDGAFMKVCQLIGHNCGWPLTIFMTPDQRPFFAGTYFPKRGRFGQSGMLELIPKVREFWSSRREDLIRSADRILQSLRNTPQRPSGERPGPEVLPDILPDLLPDAYEELRSRYDLRYGGFGDAPKFPMPHTLLFLLRYWNRYGASDALDMVENTLQAMRRGGIYDHVGFGFHRYATDAKWVVPHFEKMLYDQALLSIAYTEAFQVTRNPDYEETAREILTYVLRSLRSPEGGFYSAEDAESEGEEGKFYLWTECEIQEALDPEAAAAIIKAFNVQTDGNFIDPMQGQKTGGNIFFKSVPQGKTAQSLHGEEDLFHKKVDDALRVLFDFREKRGHPLTDDKILTDWNGLMIAALAQAARVFDDRTYLDAAIAAAEFILGRLRDPSGLLLHRYRNGHAGIRAFLDDYAFLIWGLIEIYETGFDVSFLKRALALNQKMLQEFEDETQGGFFFTASEAEESLLRRKEIYDGAVPSGNSVAMLNLLRLARLTGDAGLEETAAGITEAFLGDIGRMPSAHSFFLMAADFALGPALEVVIAGSRDMPDTQEMLKALQSRFIPNQVVLLKETDDAISDLAEFTRTMSPLEGKPTAFVCTAQVCRRPVTTIAEMLDLLK